MDLKSKNIFPLHHSDLCLLYFSTSVSDSIKRNFILFHFIFVAFNFFFLHYVHKRFIEARAKQNLCTPESRSLEQPQIEVASNIQCRDGRDVCTLLGGITMLSMALHQLCTLLGLFRSLLLVYREEWRSHHLTRAVR